MNISICIVGFNCQESLKETLDNIYTNDMELVKEVIYLDNGSLDDSYKVASSLSGSYKNLKIHRLYEANGLYNAFNECAKLAQGTHLVFTSPNVFWEKNRLSHQMELILNNDIAISATQDNCLINTFNYPQIIETPNLELFTSIYNMLVSKHIFLSAGGFNQYFGYLAQLKFLLELKSNNSKMIFYNNDALVKVKGDSLNTIEPQKLEASILQFFNSYEGTKVLGENKKSLQADYYYLCGDLYRSEGYMFNSLRLYVQAALKKSEKYANITLQEIEEELLNFEDLSNEKLEALKALRKILIEAI